MLISAKKIYKDFQIFWKSPFFGQISFTCAKKWPSTAQTKNDTKKCIKTKMFLTLSVPHVNIFTSKKIAQKR